MTVRVILADDHKIMREGIHALLENEPGIEVIGEADGGETAVRMALERRPDVVLMDITMPDLSGIEATRRILADMPQVKVVALSMQMLDRKPEDEPVAAVEEEPAGYEVKLLIKRKGKTGAPHFHGAPVFPLTDYRLDRMWTISPSLTTYSLPSSRSLPFAFASLIPPSSIKSCHPITSARTNPCARSVCTSPAASTAVALRLVVHARTSSSPTVKKDCWLSRS